MPCSVLFGIDTFLFSFSFQHSLNLRVILSVYDSLTFRGRFLENVDRKKDRLPPTAHAVDKPQPRLVNPLRINPVVTVQIGPRTRLTVTRHTECG